MLDFELAHSTEEVDAETSTRSLTVKAEPRDSEGSSCDSLVKDLWIGQKLLQQLDEGSSTPSDPTLLHQERLSMDALSNPPSLKRHSVRLSKSSDSPESHAMAVYLRSPNLNRHLQLPRPYPDRPLNVSLAEVGSASGSPVLIFLGIGCVRYLIALFDDLAKALDLRLICIDRWGYGKTDPVPTDRRSPMLWAQVVEKVMDELKIRDFRIIAHSAGAPFAAAVALRLGNRITGKMQFLAPWVSPEIDGGYKWLKWIPNGVIKSATAAEWRLQSYLLGKPPPLVHQPVEHTAEGLSLPTPSPGRPSIGQRAHSDTGAKVEPRRSLLSSPSPVPSRAPSIIRRASSVFAKNHTAPVQDKDLKRQPIIKHLRSSVLLRSHSEDDGRSPFKAISPRGSSDFSSSVPVSEKHSLTIKSEVFSASYEGDILEFLTDGFSLSGLPATPSPTPSKNRFSVLSPLPSPFRQSSTPTTRSTSPIRSGIDVQDEPKPSLGPALTQALMQASHAECEPGTTTEILTVVLNRGEKPWGFSYADLRQPVTIHWGELDDKVSEKSVRWMERNMNQGGGATVQIIKGEGHNLMTNAVVMCDIFQALRKEVKEERADAERGVKERVMMSRSRRR
ncbi:Alpha/Beta hydrolase protein [Kockovaella imperatae]|uniref:Alpha/Beta hydrolase protein n=1 Tax=Kockovaella imperatae TaxID=4999 RepID=A0A1Y1U5V5_9TREE|nr:Alpha/Beta hydrolase protein [Kockovaella imperatae]ORX33410.1 Alpha/Beta hydrolase protein [Kockovaella imperatae]